MQLHSTTPKELSPSLPGAAEKEEVENEGGEETQQMELVVADMGDSDGHKTSDDESDAEREGEQEKEEGEAGFGRAGVHGVVGRESVWCVLLLLGNLFKGQIIVEC